jgi:Kef-type K+ transport system membrane component KefB
MLEMLGVEIVPNILAIIGLVIAVSFLGSKVFQRFGIPQVVGFIVIGVILGPSFLNFVPIELTEELTTGPEYSLYPSL